MHLPNRYVHLERTCRWAETHACTHAQQVPGEWMGKLFSVMLLVHRLLSSGPDEVVMETWTH